MKKLLFSAILAFALIAAQVGVAFAQDTTTLITGTVQSVALETDATTGETTVLVILIDDLGETQTLQLSVETAEELGLVTTITTVDPVTGETQTETTVNEIAADTVVEIYPSDVITEEEEDQHPVGSALADFFSATLGVDYETVMDYHDQGAGFGVIAQALWITTQMEGDTVQFQTIVDAKLSGDYSAITLEDGTSPKNWGQFKKAILKGESQNSLGDVMSGKSESSDEANAMSEGNNNKEEKGKKEKGNKGNGNGQGHGHGNDK